MRPPGRAAVTDLQVSGMTCNNCVRHVTEALQGVPGVRTVTTQLESGSAQVRWNNPKAANVEALFDALKEAGYKGTLKDSGSASTWSPLAGWRFNVFFGIAVTAPLMILEWVFAAASMKYKC